ncbi:hypothetical protein [Pseudosporangium ferrugineum]|uniref:PPE family protein n=1 Tax=Pseudosporangium ferrugineum TaxID=439699 RepID=A0A2T0S4I5_9ACTN|nr:hypothetical protein [Pseudosporangium ferrugineum]PRY28338.1 hypothetical protein CLV70_108130 [Pseudosporangium ferrugineum]
MLIADGGGGYGGTDWNSTDVRYMWSAIADQETDKHYDVVAGWRQTADLTLTHLGQVQMYRDNLASVWPPSKSPAAAAYLQRLDSLIADLQATHEAASANYTVFATVTLTLSQARHKLKPLLDQFEANEKANLTWKTKQDAQLPDPNEAPKISAPPVSTAQQEALNNQARIIMYDLSSTVISGQSALQKPKPYDPIDAGSSGGEKREKSDEGSGFALPPVIPPPGGGGSTATLAPSSSNVSTATQAGHVQTSTGYPTAGGPTLGQTGSGPVLGGAGPSTVAPPPLPGPPPQSLLPGVSQPSQTGLIPGLMTPGSSGGKLPSAPAAPITGRPPNALLPHPNIGSGPGSRSINPPGGIIGANPGNGIVGQTPSNTAGSRSARTTRVNPVGGIIGQNGTLPGRTGTSRTSTSPTTASLAPHSSRSHERGTDSTQSRFWDPDNPWATEEGVDPVLMPQPEAPPINPGPAIGLAR